jgi:hypothetical protein
MKILLSVLLSLFLIGQVNYVYSADQFTKSSPAATDSPGALHTLIQANNNAIDRFFAYGRFDCKISYATAATLTVGAGSVVTSNSDASVRMLRTNTAATTVGWSSSGACLGLDTGSEAAGVTYYIYAVVVTSNTDGTFTLAISANASAPQGATHTSYRRLGSFYNDADGNISNIKNDDQSLSYYDSGWFAVSGSSTYTKTHNLGTTKVLALAYWATDSSGTGMQPICFFDGGGSSYYGMNLESISTTAVTLRTYVAWSSGSLPGGSNFSGYARIILISVD